VQTGGNGRPILGTVSSGNPEREEPLEDLPPLLPSTAGFHLPDKRDARQGRFAEYCQPSTLAQEKRQGTRSIETDSPLLERRQRPPFVLKPRVVSRVTGDLDDGSRLPAFVFKEEQKHLLRVVVAGRRERPAETIDCCPCACGNCSYVGWRTLWRFVAHSAHQDAATAQNPVDNRGTGEDAARVLYKLPPKDGPEKAPLDVVNRSVVAQGCSHSHLVEGGRDPKRRLAAESIE
jgi:hypothetical protein